MGVTITLNYLVCIRRVDLPLLPLRVVVSILLSLHVVFGGVISLDYKCSPIEEQYDLPRLSMKYVLSYWRVVRSLSTLQEVCMSTDWKVEQSPSSLLRFSVTPRGRTTTRAR